MPSQQAPISLVLRYSALIKSALESLNRPWSNLQCEQLAVYLLRTMGSEARDYHRPEHTLDVARLLDPVPRLAAFFHDIVYVQVDLSWHKTLRPDLGAFVPSMDHSLHLPEALKHNNDPWINAIVEIFGMEGEIEITPPRGLNEFLSAIIFYQKMKGSLEPLELIRGIACIETSILTVNETRGEAHFDKLKPRLEKALRRLGITSADKNFYGQVYRDCRSLITQDRMSFALAKPGLFLANTWDVLIENNPGLRNTFFLISEYRKAIGSTLKFLEMLSPEILFWMDLTQESDRVIRDRCATNLKVGREYLRAIRNSLLILEVIAQETGDDAPIEYFMGPIKRSREHQPVCLEDHLPQTDSKNATEFEKEVFTLLKEGRGNRSRFDRKNAPLAAFYYGATMGETRIAIERACDQWLASKSKNSDLLASLPKAFLHQILSSLEPIAKTRTQRLKMLAEHYS